MSFNPRTHVGCDTLRVRFLSSSDGFNPRTHVGCDLPAVFAVFAVPCFNPRTHVGCDSAKANDMRAAGLFQSTHPRRVRLPYTK